MPYYYANKLYLLKECPKMSPDMSMKRQESELGGGLERPMSSEGCIVGRGQREQRGSGRGLRAWGPEWLREVFPTKRGPGG